MLRIQEICKEQGITMQELAARMKISYQALYAVASGNPTIGKLEKIASALNVHVTDIISKKTDKGFIALVCDKEKLYKASNTRELDNIIKQIKFNNMDTEEKDFRLNRPYGLVYDTNNNKGLFFNRYYQRIGELNGITSIYGAELLNSDMSQLTDEHQRVIFQTINNENTYKIGFFYSDATNPYNSRDIKIRKELNLIYENRISKLSKLIDLFSLGY